MIFFGYWLMSDGCWSLVAGLQLPATSK